MNTCLFNLTNIFKIKLVVKASDCRYPLLLCEPGGPRPGPETVWRRNVGASGVTETGKKKKRSISRNWDPHRDP